MRVGIGYDSHRFDASIPLILGGVSIPDHPGLKGHSDGDALCHAVTDALLGAAAAGNIGSHFPPDDDRWKGADSTLLLARAAEVLEERGFRAVNIDATIVCETPKIGPWIERMARRLGEVVGIAAHRISIKGKTNEGMGWIGAGEGLAVHAVALIEPIPEADQPAR